MSDLLVKSENPKPGISVISLNRPEKRNALNIDLMKALYETIEKVQSNPDIRVIILRGEGPVFCAGLDLVEAQDEKLAALSSEWISQTFTNIYRLPIITIAAVHGAAIAGGAGIMAGCDFSIATEETTFSFPETRRGLVAAQVMPFLMRQLRQRDIRELLLLGEPIDTKKALAIGLLNRSVKFGDLMPEAYRFAELAMKGAPNAIEATKDLMHALYPSRFPQEIEEALKVHEEVRVSDEAKEGIAAFLEKRNPSWIK